MFSPDYTGRFKKDVELAGRRGKDLEKLKVLILLLLADSPLPSNNRDHALVGNWKGARECHIEPNWLLIYTTDREKKVLRLERTGSHSDLFD